MIIKNGGLIYLMANNNNLSMAKIKKTLSIGQVFPNYTQLCNALNEKPTTGHSKELQIQNWQRYFEFERDGYKLTITKIYDKEVPKIDKRKWGNRSIYVDYIEVLLMRYLSQCDGCTETFYKIELYDVLGMVNKNFIEYNRITKQDKRELVKSFETASKYDIADFYTRVHPKLRDILYSALRSMKSRCLIDFSDYYEIIERNGDDYTIRDATYKEHQKILDIEHTVLHEMGLTKKFQLYTYDKNDEFYSKVRQIERDELGFERVSKKIRIINNRNGIIKDLPMVEAQLRRKMLNQIVHDKIDEQAEAKFKKTQKEFDDQYSNGVVYTGNYIGNGVNAAYNSTYLIAQKELSDYFIKLELSEYTNKVIEESIQQDNN